LSGQWLGQDRFYADKTGSFISRGEHPWPENDRKEFSANGAKQAGMSFTELSVRGIANVLWVIFNHYVRAGPNYRASQRAHKL